MSVNTKNFVSITEANQNFSKVAQMVEEYGSVVILKNNNPRYIVKEYTFEDEDRFATKKEIKELSKQILKQYRKAYEELAK